MRRHAWWLDDYSLYCALKAKHRGERALALTGVAVVSAVASVGAYEGAKNIADFMAEPEPVTRELTPDQKQATFDRSQDTQPEVPGIQR